MTLRSDDALLGDLKKAADFIKSFLEGVDEKAFTNDYKTSSSVCYQLAVIGEAANKLSKSYTSQFQQVPWRQIIGLRNHL